MDDTRLIVEVEKQKVMTHKILCIRTCKPKKRHGMQWIDHLIIHEVTNE